jgi:hypothetical protein
MKVEIKIVFKLHKSIRTVWSILDSRYHLLRVTVRSISNRQYGSRANLHIVIRDLTLATVTQHGLLKNLPFLCHKLINILSKIYTKSSFLGHYTSMWSLRTFQLICESKLWYIFRVLYFYPLVTPPESKGRDLLIHTTSRSNKLMKDLMDHPSLRVFCLSKQKDILCKKQDSKWPSM